MKRKQILAAFVLLILVLCGGAVAYEKWWLTRPSVSNFDAAVKRILVRQGVVPTEGIYFFPDDGPCINLPRSYFPDTKPQRNRAFLWHIDVPPEGSEHQGKEESLQKLEALAAVGLLAKSTDLIEVKDQVMQVSRFTLTAKGWAFVGYANDTRCLHFAKRAYQGITGFRLAGTGTPNPNGIEIYEVKAMFGVPAVPGLAEWARDPSVQAAFPEISNGTKAKEEVFLLAKDESGWREFRQKASVGQSPNVSITRMWQKLISTKYSEPPPTPTPEEIRSLLRQKDWLGQGGFSYTKCLTLPGSDRVDKDLSSVMKKYSVAIYASATRPANSRMVQKTIPYLESLEQAGILTKRKDSISVPGTNDPEGRKEVYVYELAPPYADKIDVQHHCFDLGRPTLEFVTVEVHDVAAVNTYHASFKFKVKLRFDNAPIWMKDQNLKNSWKELGNALDLGKACEGGFDFDREKRISGAGGGGCWWAFESAEEAL